MRLSKSPWILIGLFAVHGCAHREPAPTGDDLRRLAAADLAAAEQARAKYDPEKRAVAVTPRSQDLIDAPPVATRVYNPTAVHLAEADRRMQSAFKHLEAARRLETFESAACAGISTAQRIACPLVAPYIESIAEGPRGVVLNIKSAERARMLAIQMACHLAFAQANNFERVPCPLYMKGVAIALTGERAIEVSSMDPQVSAAIREEARLMFGEAPPENVSSR